MMSPGRRPSAASLIESTRDRLGRAENATPRRMKNLERALRSYEEGSGAAASLPYAMFIEASNGCNLRCPLCPTGAGTLTRQVQNMDLDAYRAVIEDVADEIFEVHFAFFGEPLRNPNLPAMVRAAAERGVTTRLMTNGTLMTRRRADALVDAGLDRVTISVDGLDQESYEVYRVGGLFERVLHSMRMLDEARQAMGRERPWIEAQVLALRHTEGLLDRARRDLLAWGADEVKIKAASLELVAVPAADARGYLPVDDSLRYYDVGADGAPTFRHRGMADEIEVCPAMYLEPGVIMSSGETAMCCRDPDGAHGYGSAFSGGFRSVWDGPRMVEARERFADPERRPAMCRECPILTMSGFQMHTSDDGGQ